MEGTSMKYVNPRLESILMCWERIAVQRNVAVVVRTSLLITLMEPVSMKCVLLLKMTPIGCVMLILMVVKQARTVVQWDVAAHVRIMP
jgi:hypothetical protein